KVYSSKANRIVNYPAKSLCRGVTQAKNANLCAQRATVKIKARALDANTAFYRDAKIAPNQLFRGKEFVLTIGARCKLYASIPGPNISKRCPSALRGLDFSKDFKPQLGGNRPLNILEYTLSGRPLGLSIDSGVGYAAINPGAALQAVSGKIKLTVEGTKAKTSSKKLSFDTRSQRFTVTEDVNRGQGAWGIQLKKPKYKVGVRVVPRLEVEVGVDLGVYEWVRTFGPYDVDAVAINLGSFTFDRHKGTASSWNLPIDTRLEQ
ncbi:MAG: hypothetical protein KAG28_10480, partial [Cocleimonas sp.]|nr:hypothetical protein [Cocleimonas sp.]